jgi:hypothetical protein
MPTLKISSIAAAKVAPSGETITVTAETTEGERQFEFEASTLPAMLSQLSGMAAEAQRIQASAAGKPFLAQARRAEGFRANPSLESRQVVLTFQTSEGFEHHFSIASESIDRVCNELQKAAQKSKSSTPLKRQ